MTEGISKERLKELLTESSPNFTRTLKWLIHNECTELDPWIPIDENTPKDKEMVFITKKYGKVIGKWFDTGEVGWWTANCTPVTPTHYKLLQEDPK